MLPFNVDGSYVVRGLCTYNVYILIFCPPVDK